MGCPLLIPLSPSLSRPPGWKWTTTVTMGNQSRHQGPRGRQCLFYSQHSREAVGHPFSTFFLPFTSIDFLHLSLNKLLAHNNRRHQQTNIKINLCTFFVSSSNINYLPHRHHLHQHHPHSQPARTVASISSFS